MPPAIGLAPGRINLIGEHTDYNDGLVLPIALGLAVTAETRARDDRIVRVTTDAETEPREVMYELGRETRDGAWGDRICGLTSELGRRRHRIGGFDAAITSTLPLGAGLGSSAAFAIALLRALDGLFGLGLDDRDVVNLAHAAETGPFVGARSGLLDQLASVYGRQDSALLIDLRDGSTERIALPAELELAVIDSGTRHEHATGGYNARRSECEAASRHLGVSSLRELEDHPLDGVIDRLPAPLDRRARHVLTENARVRETVAALRSRDLARIGRLLDASHASLRDDYQVSTAELDRLVELARGAGAIGARLVGGGFGGSIIALAPHGRARNIGARVVERFAGGRLLAVVP